MEQIECSETSAYNNQTPGKYPKEYTQVTNIRLLPHNTVLPIYGQMTDHLEFRAQKCSCLCCRDSHMIWTCSTDNSLLSTLQHLSRRIATKYKQKPGELAATKKWKDSHKIWAEYKDKPRMQAIPSLGLKTGHECLAPHLTLWRRNYYFLILAHPVYKMRII